MKWNYNQLTCKLAWPCTEPRGPRSFRCWPCAGAGRAQQTWEEHLHGPWPHCRSPSGSALQRSVKTGDLTEVMLWWAQRIAREALLCWLGVDLFAGSAPVPLCWWFSGAELESGEAHWQTHTAEIHGEYKLQKWGQLDSLRYQHRTRFACGKEHDNINLCSCGTDVTQVWISNLPCVLNISDTYLASIWAAPFMMLKGENWTSSVEVASKIRAPVAAGFMM